MVETRDYAPFGESIAHVGAFSVQHRFTGQPQDDLEGGLYNYGARFYNPKWGRFVSPDEMVQSFDSQGLNPFTYVLNRPTSWTDPTGNQGDGGMSGIGGGLSAFSGGIGSLASVGSVFGSSGSGAGSTSLGWLASGGGKKEEASASLASPVSDGYSSSCLRRKSRGSIRQGVGSDPTSTGTGGSAPLAAGDDTRVSTSRELLAKTCVSPASGVVTRPVNRVYREPPYRSGAVVVTPEGHEIKLFYVDLDRSLVGKSVEARPETGDS